MPIVQTSTLLIYHWPQLRFMKQGYFDTILLTILLRFFTAFCCCTLISNSKILQSVNSPERQKELTGSNFNIPLRKKLSSKSIQKSLHHHSLGIHPKFIQHITLRQNSNFWANFKLFECLKNVDIIVLSFNIHTLKML